MLWIIIQKNELQGKYMLYGGLGGGIMPHRLVWVVHGILFQVQ